MVILVSTLIIINSSVNSKRCMGLLCNLSKGLQSICYATASCPRVQLSEYLYPSTPIAVMARVRVMVKC